MWSSLLADDISTATLDVYSSLYRHHLRPIIIYGAMISTKNQGVRMPSGVNESFEHIWNRKWKCYAWKIIIIIAAVCDAVIHLMCHLPIFFLPPHCLCIMFVPFALSIKICTLCVFVLFNRYVYEWASERANERSSDWTNGMDARARAIDKLTFGWWKIGMLKFQSIRFASNQMDKKSAKKKTEIETQRSQQLFNVNSFVISLDVSFVRKANAYRYTIQFG